jgi:hypothetical protein
MPKYTVPINRKVLDVYVVEAKSGPAAVFEAATQAANGVPPTHTRELSRTVGAAKTVVPDEPAADAATTE